MKIIITLTISLIFSVFSFAADYYWIGGTGNWSDINHWATTSGGTVLHPVIPTLSDNVFFDENSAPITGNMTVTMDGSVQYCKNMIWDGVPNVPTLLATNSAAFNIYGSLRLQPGMVYKVDATTFMSNSPSVETISTFGVRIGLSSATHNGDFNFNGTATWELQDNLHCGSLTGTRGGITLTKGTLKTNGHNMNLGYFNSTSDQARVLDINHSVVIIRRDGNSAPVWVYTGANHQLIADQSKLDFIGKFMSSVQFNHSLRGTNGDEF